jgi:hypothetical protein
MNDLIENLKNLAVTESPGGTIGKDLYKATQVGDEITGRILAIGRSVAYPDNLALLIHATSTCISGGANQPLNKPYILSCGAKSFTNWMNAHGHELKPGDGLKVVLSSMGQGDSAWKGFSFSDPVPLPPDRLEKLVEFADEAVHAPGIEKLFRRERLTPPSTEAPPATPTEFEDDIPF